MRHFVAIILCLLAAACARDPKPVTFCELARNPAKYNHREIEISAFVSHGFEDFTLFDPACESPELEVWLEYGGKYNSGTIYCCNDPSQERGQDLVVDGVTTSLVRDRTFERFDASVQRQPDSLVYATLRGHYFSGEKQQLPGGTFWVGYGHFGLASLFVIEQVVRVAPHDLPNIDYAVSYDHPDMPHEGCFASGFHVPSRKEAVAQQQQADRAGAAWRFIMPERVITDELQWQLGGDSIELHATKVLPGRIVFEGTVRGRSSRYLAVVSRPYWLSHVAADRRRVVWVLTAAYEHGCPDAHAQ